MADIIKKEEQADLMAQANSLAKSAMIPEHFQKRPADCYFAAELASSLGLPVVEIMRALYPSRGGKWGWSAEFMIAQLVRSGCIKGTLTYEKEGEGQAFKVRCSAIDAATGERVAGPWVTWKIVKAEGWDRNKKYQTIPEHMMCLRAATWFIRLQYPSVLMGHRPADELEDIEAAARQETREAQETAEARYSPAARVIEVEAEEPPEQTGEVEFTTCGPCSGAGCVLCEGTGSVPR